MKRAMIANAAEVVAVSSADKLGSAGPYVVGPLDELTHLVTESVRARRAARPLPRPRHRGRARLMRATRVAITLFFLADGLLLGSWAARIPAVQRAGGPDQHTARRRAVRGVARSDGRDAGRRAGSAERIGSRRVTRRRAARRQCRALSRPRSRPASPASPRRSSRSAPASARSTSRRTCRASRSSACTARPILSSFHAAFSGGACRRRRSARWPRRGGIGAADALRRRRARARLGALVRGGDCSRRPRAEPRHARRSPGRLAALLLLGAAAFFTLLAEGAAADWSAVYLSHSLGATAAVAALGYTGFSLAMATSRTVGDRLNGRFGPVALARGGGLLAARASGSRSSAARRRPRLPASPRWARASASSCPCCSAPPARRRASRRASASRPSR